MAYLSGQDASQLQQQRCLVERNIYDSYLAMTYQHSLVTCIVIALIEQRDQ